MERHHESEWRASIKVAEIAPNSGMVPVKSGTLLAVQAELAALRAENEKLKTVMIAAAEEIQAHWEAHCDAEGYGPANLMRRLEEGIPSEYGYTAGAFEALRAENTALRELVAELNDHEGAEGCDAGPWGPCPTPSACRCPPVDR